LLLFCQAINLVKPIKNYHLYSTRFLLLQGKNNKKYYFYL